jgi:hypothetical protein
MIVRFSRSARGMTFAISLGMQDAVPSSSRRNRWALIALLALLLILLPLYLWPLRGGLSGVPGTSAPPGSVRDPRSAAAVAQISSDVWNALMGRTPAAAPSSPSARPRPNLTMITSAEVPGSGLPGLDDEPLPDSPSALARGLLAQFGTTGVPDGSSGGGDAASPSTDPASASEDGAGTGGAPAEFSLGGYFSLGNLGMTGGGPGGGLVETDLGGPGDPVEDLVEGRRSRSGAGGCGSGRPATPAAGRTWHYWVRPHGGVPAAGWGFLPGASAILGDKFWSLRNHLLA